MLTFIGSEVAHFVPSQKENNQLMFNLLLGQTTT